MPDIAQRTGGDTADTIRGGDAADLVYGYDPAALAAASVAAVRLASGLTAPLYVTAAPGDPGRLFVVEKGGRILALNALTGEAAGTPFLDVRDQVPTSSEQGLLGLAFDPGFAVNGLFYVNLVNRAGDTEIRSYRVSATDPGRADPATAKVLLTIDQPEGLGNHKAGWLGFGPDGMLYAALGDGGGGGDPLRNGQNPDTLLGKMLRLEVRADGYSVPADNPFVGGPGADEVYALGLRNPWRASFDRATGEFWIADVGQGAWEEVNRGAAGANYGWNLFEGPDRFSQGDPTLGTLTGPVHIYGRDAGRSVTGGYVYRGPAEAMQGQYVFGDFVTGRVFALSGLAGTPASADLTARIAPDAGTVNQIASFGEDGQGALYLVGLDGELFRLEPRGTSADAGDDIDGGAGNDVLYGGAGADTLAGGEGADVLHGQEGADLLSAGPGRGGDRLFGQGGADTLAGGLGDDLAEGGEGADRAATGAGDDTLMGGAGDDALDGGAGTDTAVYAGARAAYEVTALGGGGYRVRALSGPEGTDTLVGVERLRFGDATLTLASAGQELLLRGIDGRVLAWETARGADGFTDLLVLQGGTVIAGTGDFDGDGRADPLFRLGGGGHAWWKVAAGPAGFTTLPDLGPFAPVRTGDFLGDGASDLLLHDAATGTLRFLDVATGAGRDFLTLLPGFSVAGAGNLDGRGTDDVLFRNDATGALFHWDGAGFRDLLTLAPGWRVEGVGDFVGGSGDDLLLFDEASRALLFWDPGRGADGFSPLVTLAADWFLLRTGDVDGDARADVLLMSREAETVYWNGSRFVELGRVLAQVEAAGFGDYL